MDSCKAKSKKIYQDIKKKTNFKGGYFGLCDSCCKKYGIVVKAKKVGEKCLFGCEYK